MSATYAGDRLANTVAQFLGDGDKWPLKIALADYRHNRISLERAFTEIDEAYGELLRADRNIDAAILSIGTALKLLEHK